MTIPVNRSKSFNQRTIGHETPKSPSFGTIKVNRIGVLSFQFSALLIIGFLLFFTVAIAGSYFFLLPHLPWATRGFHLPRFNDSTATCDFFDGEWVIDDSYPLYNASECPFAEQGFNCLGNGRKDEDYLKWRWRPRNCNIQRFNVSYVLEKIRNKRIVFVGDSMSRTQWESFICLLMTGVEDKNSVYEVNSSRITKQIRYLCVRFSSFNSTVEFFRSVFLVEQSSKSKHAPRRVKSTLKLDKLDDISNEWIDSDVLVFNTGQWWVSWKIFETGCYFQVGNTVKLGMPISNAFRIALETWASWIKERLDTQRTHVFLRTYEPSHWSIDGNHKFCNVTRFPSPEKKATGAVSFAEIAMDVVKRAEVPASVLQVTAMSASRSDAHVGGWNDEPSTPDCSHWCLPGVPDMWNEVLLSIWLS